MPLSPAEQALPRPMVAQAISLLAEVLKFERPADGVLSQYFKTHRELGHADRGRLAELIYAILRHLASLRAVVARSAPPEGHEARHLVLAALVRLQGRNLREIEHLLKGDENEWFGRLKAAGQEKSETMTPAVSHEWPEWLETALAAMPDADRDALARSLLQPAPLDLRINPLRAKRPEILAQLDKHGIVAEETPYSPWGMRVEGKPAIQRHPAFEKGDIEVQDEGSQLLVAMLAPKRGEMVLDFCAGAGGKTLLMGALMKNTGRLYATDISEKRLAKLGPRVARAGLSNVQTIRIAHERDDRIQRLAGKFDRVLVDAPCSGTGTLRRNPDLKWRQSVEQVNELSDMQAKILEAAAPLVRPGGLLVYATCSLLDQENGAIQQAFSEKHTEFEVVNPVQQLAAVGVDLPTDAVTQGAMGLPGLQLLPHRHNTDGFFAAVWRKKI
ncbi:MAG: RsmB/NOP family class I SAM-dependent RNA methyltransferase [Rhodocyclaceae bacterium]|nr:RsmB/NOP family class I SAM-dependent RNA methyltransferase [Rhodocyclaceae bacterium]